MAFKKLHQHIQKALEICNYTTPTPVQNQAIPEILDGHDIVASAQTGSGKTAAFVLPALHYLLTNKVHGNPSILILTPTRELATQIVAAARKYGSQVRFNITSLVGGMSYEPQIRDLKRGADIIVATPGRLIDHLENKRVNLSHVKMLVLDEADRMLDMGFIEDVDKIASLTPNNRQTLLFSATVDKSIIQVVQRLLNDPVHIDLSKEKISTPKIQQTVYKAKNMQHKTRMLKHFLNDENIYKAIIFTATKTLADQLATELRGDGFAAAALHGDLRQNVRNRTIDAFRRNKVQFLVATDVAARGLDIQDITHVFNFDLPRFSEDYVHRIGRTGRAGKTGEAISFCAAQDLKHLQKIERYTKQRLTILHDKFEYAESQTNTRSDATKFSPDAMLKPAHGGGRQRDFNKKPGRRFERSERSSGSSDKSYQKAKKLYEEYEETFGKSRPQKREFNDENRSFKKPERRFEKQDGDSRAPFRKDVRKSRDSENSYDQPRRKPFDRSSKPRDDKEFKPFNRSPKSRDDNEFKSFERSSKPRDSKEFKPRGNKASKPFDRSSKPRDSKEFKPFNRSSRPRDDNEEFKPNKFSPKKGKSSSRRENVFERPVYEFERRDDNPKVLYKKLKDKPSKDKPSKEKSSRSSFARDGERTKPSGKFTKKPFRQAKKKSSHAA